MRCLRAPETPDMDEPSALRVVAIRAVETADAGRTVWTDEDRAWASRAAAEVVGAQASPDEFLARRAELAIEKLGARQPALARAVRALRWRSFASVAVVAGAFALGFVLDQVDRSQRINILSPPVLGLLTWNIAVYVAIVVSYVVRYGDAAQPGPLRGALTRIGGGLVRPRRGGALREAIAALIDDWARRSASLYRIRATRILHVAAAALAAGVISGLYLRGLALEYRAGWESTFLDASTVRSIVAVAYAPGAWITQIPVPDIEAVTAIRSPASENAARWVHLMAATVALIVIVPRLALALVAGLLERHRATHMQLPYGEPYFQRLLRGFRGGAARVRVIPYSYTPPAAAIAGLEAVIARGFGGGAATIVAPPVAYGAEDPIAGVEKAGGGATLVALFNASATPEREVHGEFLAALGNQRIGAEALLAFVDESGWAARWKGEPTRIADRRKAWQQLGSDASVPVVFVDLSAPDLDAAEKAFDAALSGSAR